MTSVTVESILEKSLLGFKQRALSIFILVLLVYILNGLSHTKLSNSGDQKSMFKILV